MNMQVLLIHMRLHSIGYWKNSFLRSSNIFHDKFGGFARIIPYGDKKIHKNTG